jgi:inosose dehydratase
VEKVARAVLLETGLSSVFHHHCAGYVETPDEVEALLTRTSPELVNLCLDTGHWAFGGGDPVEALARWRDRIGHIHFKDHSPEAAQRVRKEELDYFAAVRAGVFCELGKGDVDFASILSALGTTETDRWIVVEQDVLPGMGTPYESAVRNRQFLKGLGL